MRTVTDYLGREIPEDKAKKIRGEYYLIDVDCFKVEGLYYRKDSKKIIYDHSRKKYIHVLYSYNLNKGIVGPNEEVGSFSLTSDTINIAKKVEGSWRMGYALNEQVARINGYQESLNNDIFYKLSDCTPTDRLGLLKRIMPNSEKVNNLYNIEDSAGIFLKLSSNYENLRIPVGKEMRILARNIPFSWGIEAEISNGFLPSRIREPLGVTGLRDGSVSNTGTEYVTVPYSGAKGIATTVTLFNELKKRCVLDFTCSLHAHFGNVRSDKLYVISLYSLCLKIQDELFTMFPYGRLHPRDGGQNGNKIYCAKLDPLGLDPSNILKSKTKEQFDSAVISEFSKIYVFLNQVTPGTLYKIDRLVEEKVVEGKEMYRVRRRGPKWNRTMRYYWMNLLPLYFSKGKTIEFRPHEATLNPIKVINWLCICTAILKYAEDYSNCLTPLKISIKDVIKSHFTDHVGDYLVAYVEDRKKYFVKNGKHKPEPYDLEDEFYEEDEEYEFEHGGLKYIY
jgi:hypothetical protein